MSSEENIPILLSYGGAQKSSFEMSSSEFKEASTSIKKRAKEKAFSKNLPVYVKRGADIIAEFPDGRILIVTAK